MLYSGRLDDLKGRGVVGAQMSFRTFTSKVIVACKVLRLEEVSTGGLVFVFSRLRIFAFSFSRA